MFSEGSKDTLFTYTILTLIKEQTRHARAERKSFGIISKDFILTRLLFIFKTEFRREQGIKVMVALYSEIRSRNTTEIVETNTDNNRELSKSLKFDVSTFEIFDRYHTIRSARCVGVCVCVCVRERERESVTVYSRFHEFLFILSSISRTLLMKITYLPIH